MTACGVRRRMVSGAIASILLAIAIPSRADDARLARFTRPGPFAVGVRTLVLVDESRDDAFTGGKRTLVTEVWYPATDAAREGPRTRFAEFFGEYRERAERVLRRPFVEIEPRFSSLARRDAAPRKPPADARYPLIVFSHGNGGFRHQNVAQVEHLASHGHVVVSPDHTGNSRLSPLPDGAVGYDRRGRKTSAEDRPRDVSFLIDRFLAESASEESWLSGAIDGERIGVVGHSFGGYTACSVALSDPRVRAIVPMTVALAGVGKGPADVPTLVFIGEHDRTIGALGNAASRGYFLGCPAAKYLVTLRRGGHFTFCDMAVLDPRYGDGIGSGRGLDGETMEFVPVALAREIINAYTLAFLERHLGGDEDAARFLSENRYPEEVDYLTGNVREEPVE